MYWHPYLPRVSNVYRIMRRDLPAITYSGFVMVDRPSGAGFIFMSVVRRAL